MEIIFTSHYALSISLARDKRGHEPAPHGKHHDSETSRGGLLLVYTLDGPDNGVRGQPVLDTQAQRGKAAKQASYQTGAPRGPSATLPSLLYTIYSVSHRRRERSSASFLVAQVFPRLYMYTYGAGTNVAIARSSRRSFSSPVHEEMRDHLPTLGALNLWWLAWLGSNARTALSSSRGELDQPMPTRNQQQQLCGHEMKLESFVLWGNWLNSPWDEWRIATNSPPREIATWREYNTDEWVKKVQKTRENSQVNRQGCIL